MAGYFQIVKKTISQVDIVFEVLDARMIELTRIKKAEQYAREYRKPLVMLINKIDLVSRDRINEIKERYEDCILVSAKKRMGINEIIKKAKERIKGEHIRAAIIGYPNTGKSSIINRLSKGGRAKTSSESGYTKGMQKINCKGGMMLYDTPGIISKEMDEIQLGIISGISPEKLKEPELVAFELIKIFKDNNPTGLYGLDLSLDVDEVLDNLAEKNNMLKKGGLSDERRAAVKMLRDWHNGVIRI